MNKVLEHKWFVWLLTIASVAIAIATIFRLLTPKTEPIPQTNLVTQNFNNTQSTFTNIVFSGVTPEFPTTLPLASFQSSNSKTIEIQGRFISQYQLSSKPEHPTVFVGQEYFLSTTNFLRWEFAQQMPELPTGVIDVTLATNTASSFIHQFFGLEWQPYIEGVEFFETDGADYHEANADQANIATIPFTQTINGLPSFYTNQKEFPITVNITSDNQIQKLTFSPTLYTATVTEQEQPLISVADAIANINHNKAAIITSTQEEFGPLLIENIVGGTLTSVTLEYRTDEQLKIVYPFYRFTGTLTNNNRTAIMAEVITPAVATTTP